MRTVTQEQLEHWLGSSNPYEEALALILDLINNDEEQQGLIEDILDLWESSQ